jgi:hypothetical protein
VAQVLEVILCFGVLYGGAKSESGSRREKRILAFVLGVRVVLGSGKK